MLAANNVSLATSRTAAGLSCPLEEFPMASDNWPSKLAWISFSLASARRSSRCFGRNFVGVASSAFSNRPSMLACTNASCKFFRYSSTNSPDFADDNAASNRPSARACSSVLLASFRIASIWFARNACSKRPDDRASESTFAAIFLTSSSSISPLFLAATASDNRPSSHAAESSWRTAFRRSSAPSGGSSWSLRPAMSKGSALPNRPSLAIPTKIAPISLWAVSVSLPAVEASVCTKRPSWHPCVKASLAFFWKSKLCSS
mmetsp:Transcript_86700/g.242896  ORF Transcript_86700/g.242896 Transcript_86700/m.242896 type:complete len:260 (+) Transcript_86700:311-1090(+)